MQITKEGSKNGTDKLFTIYLSINDVRGIFLRTTAAIQHVSSKEERVIFIARKSELLRKDFEIEDACFRESLGDNEMYLFLSPGGFETNEAHLEWFTKLGKIPMYSKNGKISGHVMFKQEVE